MLLTNYQYTVILLPLLTNKMHNKIQKDKYWFKRITANIPEIIYFRGKCKTLSLTA